MKQASTFLPNESVISKLFPYLRDKKAQTATTLVFTLLAISFFGIFAINPTIVTIAQLRKQTADSEYANIKLQEKIRNLGQLQQLYASLSDTLPLIDNALPNVPHLALFVAQMQAVGARNQVQISGLQISTTEVTSEKIDTQLHTPFSLDVNGSKEHVMLFMEALNDFSRIISIDSVSLANQEAGTSLHVSGNIYFQQS